MKNPLTPEQLTQLQQLSKLSPEEQKKQLPVFLKTLSPEQLAFLQQQQQGEGQCPFCLIAEKKIPSTPLFEDAQFLVLFDIRPATDGHVLITPKKHIPTLDALSEGDVAQLFTLAARVSKVLVQTLSAEGVNIYLAQGSAAGQTVDHLLLHVIPRYTNDGVTFSWQGKKADEKQLQQLAGNIREKLKTPEKTLPKKTVIEDTSSASDHERIPYF